MRCQCPDKGPEYEDKAESPIVSQAFPSSAHLDNYAATDYRDYHKWAVSVAPSGAPLEHPKIWISLCDIQKCIGS